MGDVFRPEASSEAVRIAIVIAKFNEPLTSQLLDGAQTELRQITDGSGDSDVYWVPGCFEIPQTVARLQRSQHLNYDGYLTLGCLIKGDTDHYAVLAAEVTRRLGELSTASKVPLSFGVLTCQTLAQAEERADPQRENKGGEVMRALLEMIELFREVSK